MRERSLTILVIVVLLASPLLGLESIPIIEDEEDLYELLAIGEICYEEYLDLLSLLRRGVDINTDEVMELTKIPGVNQIDLLRIKEHREERPLPFKQIEDLREIPGLDEETYLRILPFIRILPRQRETFKGRLRLQVEETQDDNETAEFYNRLRLYYGRYIHGYISMKKEEGEEEFETRYRYLRLDGLGPIKRVTFGDYYAYFGQGLVIGHRFDGAMGHFKIGRVEPAVIYSYPVEQERVGGANLDLYFGKEGRIGVGYLSYGDDEEWVYGVHLNLPIEDIGVFSEWARVNDGGSGFIGGANLDIGPIWFLASYRSYDQDFTNPYSDGFADADGKDNDQDERGVYLELSYRITPLWRLVGSFDQWRHPSNLVTDSRSAVKLFCDLSKRTKLRALCEWKDEDVDRDGGARRKTSLETILHPLARTKTSLYIRCSEKDVTGSPDSQLDGYVRLKLEYEISDFLELETAVRLKDTDIYETGQSQTSYYLQWEDRLSDHLLFLSRYTNTAYSSEDDPPNPRHEFRFRLDIAW